MPNVASQPPYVFDSDFQGPRIVLITSVLFSGPSPRFCFLVSQGRRDLHTVEALRVSDECCSHRGIYANTLLSIRHSGFLCMYAPIRLCFPCSAAFGIPLSRPMIEPVRTM